jgi:tetratricopeptide repeat domain protein
MAHIIDEAEKNLKKISYIFIGTTPKSTNLNYVLSYLLGENMPYVDTEDGNVIIKNAKISFSQKDDEGISSKEDIFSYKDMCKKAVEIINSLGQKEENFVFIVDAIDQLNTNNNPEWIPEILPSNVKLIISMLNDDNYSDDSSAYNFIKDRNYKVIELKKYSKALDLLENTLKKKK